VATRFLLVLWVALVAMGGYPSAEAAPRAPRPGKAAAKKKPTKRLSTRAAAAKARAEARARAEVEAIAAGKAAVFVFDGDDAGPLRLHVIRQLKANGMRVQSDLRPPDTAEQFRDMAAALDLAIYVHGRVKVTPRGRSVATITIRAGVTGRKVASASFEGRPGDLVSMVEADFWERVKAPLGRACVDARRPGRRHNAPMRIEAGTAIPDSPRNTDG
jgi:hypothetical protein